MNKLLWCMVLVFLLSGCGPKLTPTLAEREMTHNAALNQTGSAMVGESLLAGLDTFAYAVYSPRESGIMPLPDGEMNMPLSPDQLWLALYRLDDGSQLIEILQAVAPDALRLGLRIDETGRVQGNRPWFDLAGKKRVNQFAWDGEKRLLFERNGSYPVDTFVFDLRYAGMENGEGLFDYQDFKATGIQASRHVRMTLPPKGHVQLHGLDIRITAIYPDHVRYVVEPIR